MSYMICPTNTLTPTQEVRNGTNNAPTRNIRRMKEHEHLKGKERLNNTKWRESCPRTTEDENRHVKKGRGRRNDKKRNG